MQTTNKLFSSVSQNKSILLGADEIISVVFVLGQCPPVANASPKQRAEIAPLFFTKLDSLTNSSSLTTLQMVPQNLKTTFACLPFLPFPQRQLHLSRQELPPRQGRRIKPSHQPCLQRQKGRE